MNFQPFHSLRVKLLFASLLIEAVMLALLVGNSMRLIQEHLANQAEVRIHSIQRAYSTALAQPMLERDYASLRDVLEGLNGDADITYIVVTDAAGTPLVNLDWPAGRPLPTPTPVSTAGDAIHVRFDLDIQGMHYGQVHYGLSNAFLKQARRVLLEQSIAIALTELTLTFLLLFATAYWLTRGYVALARASRRLAAGDFDTQLQPTGDTEVDALTHSFNTMAAALRERVAALRDSEQRFRAIADYTYAWENWFGPDGKLRWVNPAVTRMTGYSVEECMAMEDFPLPLVHRDDRPLLERLHREALAGHTGQDVEFRVWPRTGRTIWVAMAWQPLRGGDGASLGYRSSLRDITLQHFSNEELAYAATHDALTGLHNRHAFENELQRSLDACDPALDVTLFYIDLDQFKLINDTCGHSAGDALLQHLARSMEARYDFGYLARLGGDEFGMILTGVGPEEALRRAQHVIDDIRAVPFAWEGRNFHVGASIGIARRSDELHDVSHLLIAADTACYAAKEHGRNRAQLYLPGERYFQDRRADFVSLADISAALDENRLELHGQRIAALRPGLPDYYEVLVRLRARDGSLLPPGRFIPAAERYGQMPLLDHWVLEATCRQIRSWREAGLKVPRLNVNLSGLTLAEPGLADYIRDTFARYAVDPSRICFEITESCAISQLEQALDLIARCREIGCSMALDDFGSGLSSFAYLKRFRVDSLKIDGMFVKNADRDADDRAVIESMVRLANLRHLHTVAEFVVSHEVLTTVRRLGVDYAQGYAVHRPEPLHQLSLPPAPAAADPVPA